MPVQPQSAQLFEPPPVGWVLYDGACGLCARWVPRWTPTFTRLGLATAALQEPWVTARTGLGADELLRDFLILFNDDTVLRGADAYRWILRRRWWGLPLWLIVVVPPGRWLFDFGYRRLNRNRHQVSRWCGIVPGSAPLRGASTCATELRTPRPRR